MTKILFLSQNPLLEEYLLQKKISCVLAKDLLEAKSLLSQIPFEGVFFDPQKDLEDVESLLKEIPKIPWILLSSAEQKHSVSDSEKVFFLKKPLVWEEVDAILEKLKEKNKKNSLVIAASPSMQKILQTIEKIAKSTASVFISGESGTGKEVIAQAIHTYSKRASKPFIKVNCAAVPESLIESEFFGHEKGSFTGANQKKEGRFEMAHEGSLLLDEVTEIPLSLQPKLLRAIQEQEFERVGGVKSLQVDIRFIATSNRVMKQAIEANLFREDLFYRLNVIPIHIPPLRERKEDILPLARHFLSLFCEENDLPLKTLSSRAEETFLHYSWPGNVRELNNIIQRSVVLDIDPAELEPFSSKVEENPLSIPLQQGLSLEKLEKWYILSTFQKEKYHKINTAKTLGISVRTLRNKLQQYQRETSSQPLLFH